jgi:hypothetical protein
MKAAPYFVLLLVSLLCVALAVVLIVIAHVNGKLLVQFQSRQQALNGGLLGAQGQQISASVLRDMGNAAVTNTQIRRILEKHGYQVQMPTGTAPTSGVANATQGEPAAKGVAP